ncbi:MULTISPECIES: DUF542 domain-containing protein [Anaerococcus]|uniref:DUF542 domain-containing protein n=1 Tax=Anaerococcus TaxID=165779 RepID=UPI00242C720A|nr:MULTISPECIES: DUF542 domain-containing protein [Anaerococcus]MDD7766521.1 DUF542 domain-containing protein [Anaerococcus vaginalis]MDY6126777.1 DUF542 domain-containing protein [Anaerococcus sp.]
MIGIHTKIEDLVKVDTTMIVFFNKEKIDFCCNGYMTVADVAKEKNIDPIILVRKIQDRIYTSNSKAKEIIDLDDFKEFRIGEMIDSILIDHHKRERDLLFEIDPSLNKILSVHFARHGEELMKLHSLFADLKKELEEHFVKEEEITFPLMLENESPSQEVIKKVEELETDHEEAGDIIKEMIELTDWFKVPKDACRTYIHTFDLLEELVKDVFVHIFKENSIMFEKFRNKERK